MFFLWHFSLFSLFSSRGVLRYPPPEEVREFAHSGHKKTWWFNSPVRLFRTLDEFRSAICSWGMDAADSFPAP